MTNGNWTPEDYKNHLEDKKSAEAAAGKSKYKNKWVTIDGIKFQSTKEGNTYVEYKRMRDSGIIKDFKRQVRYEFVINGIKVSSYRADFVIELHNGGVQVVDVKSPMTRKLNDYVIRRKLMHACFGIVIHER